MTKPRSLAAIAVLAVVAAAGCGDDGDDDAGAPETTSTTADATSTTPDPTTTTDPGSSTSTPGAGCTEGEATPLEGATIDEVGDLDGDGRPDTAWIAVGDEAATTVGVQTAAGGGASRLWESASPVSREILVVDADRQGPVEILASDGRSVELWAFQDCGIHPVRNAGGATYTFSLGFTEVGTGVGCVEVDGARELVGLDIVADDQTTVEWSRTAVQLDGLEARNGETTTGTFTRPADDAAIELLTSVTCGEVTMADDGLRGA
jgi:hypothetical protein